MSETTNSIKAEGKQSLNSVGSLFASAWGIYKKKFVDLVEIIAVPMLILGIGSGMIEVRHHPLIEALGLLMVLIGVIVSIFASPALIFSIDRGGECKESYRKALPLFWPMVWMSILSAFAMLGGFIVFVIPGIFIMGAIIFSCFVLVLENRHGMDSLARSKEYVKGRWWGVFGRYLAFVIPLLIIFLLVRTIAYFIFGAALGTFIYYVIAACLTPLMEVYLYVIYKNLVALKPELAGDGKKSENGFLMASAIIGLVVPAIILVLVVFFSGLFLGRAMSWHRGLPADAEQTR